MFANNGSTIISNGDDFRGQKAQKRTCSLSIDLGAIMISFIFIYSLLVIASLVGNSLLIYASLKSKIKIGCIISNIAASDMLFSVVHLPREIVAQIKGSTAFIVHGWIGSLLCTVCAFVADASIAVSTLSMVLIAVDRLVATVFPRKYRGITVKKRRLVILSIWFLAMAIHSPYFYTFRLGTRNGETLCITSWEPAFNHKTTHTGYYTALLVTVLILPLVTVAIFNIITLLKLRRGKMAPFRTSLANRRHMTINKKLFKMSVVIVFTFAVCWLPFTALQLLLLYFQSSIPYCNLGFAIFRRFAILFSLCHCIVNPCICFCFMRWIHIVLKPRKITEVHSPACLETKL